MDTDGRFCNKTVYCTVDFQNQHKELFFCKINHFFKNVSNYSLMSQNLVNTPYYKHHFDTEMAAKLKFRKINHKCIQNFVFGGKNTN